MNSDWETLLPRMRGTLPSLEPVHRTDPGGKFDARIVILGVYPAARVRPMTIQGKRMNLPVAVERTSFELGVSASAKELDAKYLTPLELSRSDVLLVDLLPYFLANTRRTGGNSMVDNIVEVERLTGTKLGIDARPDVRQTSNLASMIPGNVERLTCYFERCRPSLVLTLGAETAGFVQGAPYATIARTDFYAAPRRQDVLGVEADVVHLAHPGRLMVRRQVGMRTTPRGALAPGANS